MISWQVSYPGVDDLSLRAAGQAEACPNMRTFVLAVFLPAVMAAQDTQVTGERWSLYYQATSIGQYHPGFYAKYSGPLSLLNHPEAEVSLTTTLFFGLRAARRFRSPWKDRPGKERSRI